MSEFDLSERAVVTRAVAIVPCRDLARSTRFYEELGFSATPYEDGTGYVFLERDGSAVHLRQMDAEEGQGCSTAGVYFYVDDADVLYDELLRAGVRCEGEPANMPWRMREFAVSDPDGTLLRFGHRVP